MLPIISQSFQSSIFSIVTPSKVSIFEKEILFTFIIAFYYYYIIYYCNKNKRNKRTGIGLNRNMKSIYATDKSIWIQQLIKLNELKYQVTVLVVVFITVIGINGINEVELD